MYRNKKLLESCRQLSCQLCDAEDGTVIAAHSNQLLEGKGKGIKERRRVASKTKTAGRSKSTKEASNYGRFLCSCIGNRNWSSVYVQQYEGTR